MASDALCFIAGRYYSFTVCWNIESYGLSNEDEDGYEYVTGRFDVYSHNYGVRYALMQSSFGGSIIAYPYHRISNVRRIGINEATTD